MNNLKNTQESFSKFVIFHSNENSNWILLDTFQISMPSSTVIVTHYRSYYLKTLLWQPVLRPKFKRRQKRSLARVLESRDNAWEGDEDVPFHRTSGRACWSMINRDNIRDRYRISIEVSALVRFSSMFRSTDRTRKNQSFSKIRTWIILWSFFIEPRKIRMEFSFSKTEIKLIYHRFVPTIREKIFPDVKFGKFDYNSRKQ